jgi:hypothetical protein
VVEPKPIISKPLVLRNINPAVSNKQKKNEAGKSKGKSELKTSKIADKGKKKQGIIKVQPKETLIVQTKPMEGRKVAPKPTPNANQATATALMETKIKAMSANIV